MPEDYVRCWTLALVTALAVPAAVGCARANAGDPVSAPVQAGLGDPNAIASARHSLDATVSDVGIGRERVVEAADALLGTQPDLAQAAHAWRVRAEALFALGDDAGAISSAHAGLSLGGGANLQATVPLSEAAEPLDADTRDALGRVWVRAMVRGGDPTAAIAALHGLVRDASGPQPPAPRGASPAGGALPPSPSPRLFSWSEWRGLLAVAATRAKQDPSALLALAAWRASMSASDPGVAWVEAKLHETMRVLRRDRATARGIRGAPFANAEHPPQPGELALAGLDEAQRQAVATCLAGEDPAERGSSPGAPRASRWTEACRDSDVHLGVLMPRSGKLATISDAQLEGIEVGLTLLSERGMQAPRISWLDPGSGDEGLRRAADQAVRTGIDAVIGPVGPDAIAHAAQALNGLTLIVPGEAVVERRSEADGTSSVEGAPIVPMAATLEQRIDALVSSMKSAGARRIVVFVPASSYGQRGRRAASNSLSKFGFKISEFIEYPTSTTSFAPWAEKLAGAKADVGILVLDALPRVEALLRQLRHDGVVGGAGRAVFASTAEGFDPVRIAGGRGPFEGALLAPPGFVGKDDPFARAFVRRFGREPSDQAVLAWRALQRAVGVLTARGEGGASGFSPESASTLVGRVQGGGLVPP